MEPLNREEIISTLAELQSEGNPLIDNLDCNYCNEEVLFALQDSCHSFSLGISTVLKCLKLAEQYGSVPKLPVDWWHKIDLRHQLHLYTD